MKDSSKITREHLQGAMHQAMKKILFNVGMPNPADSVADSVAMDTS